MFFSYINDLPASIALTLHKKMDGAGKKLMQLAFGPNTDVMEEKEKILQGNDDILTFAETLRNDTTIHTLLIKKPLFKKDSEAIAEALKKNKYLKQLILMPLGSYRGPQENIELIIDALKQNKHLEFLEIQHYDFTQVHNLQEIFKSLGKLKELFFYNCNLGDVGAAALAENLNNNVFLKALKLYETNVGCDGAVAFANALKTNNVLEWFYLHNERINDNSVQYFAGALKVNKSLEILRLENSNPKNHLNDTSLLALLNALQENRSLKTLGIDCNRKNLIYQRIRYRLKKNRERLEKKIDC